MSSHNRPMGQTVSVYGLTRPTTTHLHQAIHRVFGGEAESVWGQICRAAGIATHAQETDLDPIVAAMHRHSDGAVRLCAESFMIRANAFDHLWETEQLMLQHA